MKIKLIFFWMLVFSTLLSNAQDTFSIVALDVATRQVGSAGASCVDLYDIDSMPPSFLSELIPNIGGINTQASYDETNQASASARMNAGDTPSQIITWLQANDNNGDPSTKQYGIVGFNATPSAVGFTGANCFDYKNHITGNIDGFYYSIQGNILLGQNILDKMQDNFVNTKGNLACRLMAALQGANIIGADTRCKNTSSLFAFLKVSSPTDAYGSPSVNFGVKIRATDTTEPIDLIQIQFDAQIDCLTLDVNSVEDRNFVKVFPVPAKDFLRLEINSNQTVDYEFKLINELGQIVLSEKIRKNHSSIEIKSLSRGIYIYELLSHDNSKKTGKIVID